MELRCTGKPWIVLPQHGEIFYVKIVLPDIFVFFVVPPRFGGNEGAQRDAAAVVVQVYHPHRALPRHGFIDENRIGDLISVRTGADDVRIVRFRSVPGIKGDQGESFSVPFFGIRPVYLHSGVAQVVEIALHIGGAALGRSRGLLRKILFYERLDRDGIGCGRLHRLSTVVPHAGPGYCQQVQHHVFFVVTIGRRRTYGIVHFAHLRTADWQRRQHPGNVSFRHQRILAVVVNRFAATVAGTCGEQHHRRRNQDFG